MGDGSDNTTFKLDLDISDFAAEGLQAKGIIQSISNADSMTDLIQGLTDTTAALGVVGLAAYAFKEALDLTMEGEELQRVENQFNTLAQKAGLSGKELKEGMEGAAQGLISTNDLLVTANKALVEMGASAEQLPQILELARKATATFGGDFETNFQNITQAISVGNTRLLKHYGIVVDNVAAIQKFADAHGIAANELSKSGQQQAFLNEALEQGQKAFAGVSGELAPTKTAIQEMKVAWTEFTEAVALTVQGLTGTYFKDFFHSIAAMAHDAKTHLQAAFGKGDEADTAKLEVIKAKIMSIKGELIDIDQMKQKGLDFAPGDTIARTIALQANLKTYSAQLDALQQKKHADAADEVKTDQATADAKAKIGAKGVQDDLVNQATHKKNEEKFQQELLKLDDATEKEKEKHLNTLDGVQKAMDQQALQRARAHADAIKKIQADTSLNATQKGKLEAAENARFKEQEKMSEVELAKLRQQLMAQYVSNSTSAYNGITRAAQQMSAKAKADLKDFGAQGQKTMQSFQSNSTAAFTTLGQGIAAQTSVAKSAADAMKGFFLGMLGDRATSEGELLLASSVYPPNPVGLAAGGGLIALGAALHSLAGTSSATASAGSTGGSSGGTAPTATAAAAAAPAQTNQLQQQQNVQRTVSINIAGHYLNTQESQRTLMEVMRNETDATGFQYNKIGV